MREHAGSLDGRTAMATVEGLPAQCTRTPSSISTLIDIISTLIDIISTLIDIISTLIGHRGRTACAVHAYSLVGSDVCTGGGGATLTAHIAVQAVRAGVVASKRTPTGTKGYSEYY